MKLKRFKKAQFTKKTTLFELTLDMLFFSCVIPLQPVSVKTVQLTLAEE